MQADGLVAVEVDVCRDDDGKLSIRAGRDEVTEGVGSDEVTPFSFRVDRGVVWADEHRVSYVSGSRCRWCAAPGRAAVRRVVRGEFGSVLVLHNRKSWSKGHGA